MGQSGANPAGVAQESLLAPGGFQTCADDERGFIGQISYIIHPAYRLDIIFLRRTKRRYLYEYRQKLNRKVSNLNTKLSTEF